MSQSRCARTFGFPIGRKKHVRVQNAIRRLCAAAGRYDSDFPLHLHSQADEKDT